MSSGRVVVVGGGLGGLSAACHLAGRGLEVRLFERHDQPGGLAAPLQMDGYSFDAGPTVLTMAGILADTFAAAGSSIEDHLTLLRLDPAYRAVFADGSTLCVRAGREAMSTEIREKCGAQDALAFDRFCGWLTQLYEAELGPFIDRNYDSLVGLLRPLAPVARLVRLGGFGNLDRRVRSYFTDERLRRLFSFQSLYAGLAPHRALALYAVITYMDTIEGVFHPDGGIAAVPRALASAAEKAGAELQYGIPVERIVIAEGAGGRVRGVELASSRFVPADAVVCNLEPAAAYRTLLPAVEAPRAARSARYSPSAVVWHAGVRDPVPPEVAHHNVHFGDAWRSSFDRLLDGQLMTDPSTLVSVPTVSDPTLAPPGAHVLYALEPVPTLDGDIAWEQHRTTVRDALVERVRSFGYPTETDVESFVDPLDWQRSGLEGGTPFSLSHRFFQTGPFRPANVDRRVPGLVFVGAGTVPGVGVPMVLLSGKLAAERVDEVLAS